VKLLRFFAKSACCWLVASGLGAALCQAATFGRVVPVLGGGTDIVLDEARARVYVTSSIQNVVMVYSAANQNLLTSIATDQTPLSAALSRDGKSLYVTCYDSSVLDVIDLTALGVTSRVGLPAKPEGVAVAGDGRVLISTTGSGTAGAANVLLLYDPSPTAATVLLSISVAPAAPTPPTLPPPSGRPFLATHGQLRATRDGSTIVGVNVPGTGSPTVFVYQSASATVLRSRVIAGSSTVIAVSDDGTRFLCGPNLFDASTLQVLAQQNLANVPYPITPGSSFNLQSNQGGGVFAPGGQTLYSAFDIAPVQNTLTPTSSVSQLMLSDPDNLLVRMGIQLPENLAGKMVISNDGGNIYALSDSGFVVIPVGTISQSPLAVPSSDVVLLTKDQCGFYGPQASAALTINNPGKGRVSASAQLLQFAGVANQSNPASAPSVRSSPSAASPQFQLSYNSAATARGLGTITPPHDFLIQSPEAINIPDRVRILENNRDSDSRGSIVPIQGGNLTGEAFPDMAYDSLHQRIYIANEGLNRVEVYDIQTQQLLPPIKVGQLPVSLALTSDGNTLYVANAGGESISIIDTGKMRTIGSVAFPPIPFNSNLALIAPSVIVDTVNGPMVLMNNGLLWNVIGNAVVPRAASKLLGSTAAGVPVAIPMPSTMAASPDGQFVLLATNTGIAGLYDAAVDDWVSSRQIFTATQAGYIGPVAAGPKGQYFLMDGVVLNQSLVAQRLATGLVSAVAQFGAASYAVFAPPTAASPTSVLTAPTIQLVNANTGAVSSLNALEGPVTQVTGTARAAMSGRSMAIDTSGSTAYVITVSGLSVIPLTPAPASSRPLPNTRGAVNLASYQTAVAPNGLLSIFGTNLGANDIAGSTPLPVILGGTCVTLNNVALPLFMVSPLQINAQIPPNLAAGSYPLVVRSVAGQAASVSQQLAVSRFAPAVLVDTTGQIALFHSDGSYVNKDNPANRDERLTLYALGLGATSGGAVTTGVPSPTSPLAVTGPVQLYFGNPGYAQAAIIVDWSGLTPGFIGLYQLDIRVPGFHISGDSLLVTLKVGGVSSPSTGPVVPYVAVN